MTTAELRGWRAYHADGGTVDSSEATPRDVRDGLLGVVEFLEPPYRRIVDGGTRYWWADGRWHTEDAPWGGEGKLSKEEDVDPALVKEAAGLPDAAWREARERILTDRDWPEEGGA